MAKFDIRIEAHSLEQAKEIERGLKAPEVRAVAGIYGILKPLGEAARARVLTTAINQFNDKMKAER